MLSVVRTVASFSSPLISALPSRREKRRGRVMVRKMRCGGRAERTEGVGIESRGNMRGRERIESGG